MTVRDLLLLSWMAYLDLPPLYVSILSGGDRVPLRAFADYVLRMDAAGKLECVELSAASREAARELMESQWFITGYINENNGDGFVAYTFDVGGENVVAMRGSERAGICVASNVDWVDNVCEPFSGSVQLESIRSLTRRFASGKVIFTGHSKGGHNALVALAESENPEASAAAFNGQGFSDDMLSEEGRDRLRNRGINYVVADDVVGALLTHPERRVFVRQETGTNAHMPEAFMFDKAGNPVLARRTLRSRAIEFASRMAEERIEGKVRRGVRAVCRAALEGM
ncbi:MAG: DUF2974 domain-containing protein [Clostridia bacterium]|nr:DUF2974 domain-containing protein [Clostridia bacterium]